MGLTNAPSVFRSIMNDTFTGLEFVFLYIWKISYSFFSHSEDDHIRDIELVFDRFRKTGLIAKVSKCSLFRPSLRFLGHIVSALGILPNPSEIREVMDSPIPENRLNSGVR
jgi:hypothetical protein